MAKNNIKSKRGFTIIEVVLVLAIAGLIFLMVFIALPNMQSSQRNTQRRNDYSSLSTQVTQFVSNNNGNMPTKVVKTWLNSSGKDPDAVNYTETNVVDCANTSNQETRTVDGVSITKACKTPATPARNSDQAYIIKAATCNGRTPQYKQGDRNFAIYGYVESGASDSTYCLASHG